MKRKDKAERQGSQGWEENKVRRQKGLKRGAFEEEGQGRVKGEGGGIRYR